MNVHYVIKWWDTTFIRRVETTTLIFEKNIEFNMKFCNKCELINNDLIIIQLKSIYM